MISMKSISLQYPKSVYNAESVSFAIQGYRNICRIEVTEDKDHILCVLTNSVTDLEVTALEFCNYLIELSNVKL